jgi:hypothetical protein
MVCPHATTVEAGAAWTGPPTVNTPTVSSNVNNPLGKLARTMVCPHPSTGTRSVSHVHKVAATIAPNPKNARTAGYERID